MQDNRRNEPRLPISLSASLQDIDSTLSATVLNISSGGVFVRCANPPKKWTNVTMELNPEDGSQPIKASGVVVWVIDEKKAQPELGVFAGAGIQFTNLSAKDLERLNIIIQRAANP
jgi:uncharacterized protein (TIGR02266 family)